MLDITSSARVRTCDGVTRRDFLSVGALSAIGLSLPQLVSARSQAVPAGPGDDRSAIMIFNLGGPSQLDTWDPKPVAPSEIRGPFRPIATNAAGIEISELFPQMARHADKFSLVRSCCHTAAAVHDTGHQLMQTGRLFSGTFDAPHAGCAMSYLVGKTACTPPHVLLPGTMGRTGGNLPHGQNAGFLGRAYDPLVLNADPSSPDFAPLCWPADAKIGEVRLQEGRKLRSVVDETVRNFEASDNAQLLDSNFEAAFRLLTSPQARAAFDLAAEPVDVRQRYGMTRFGQSCLLARRLIEAGVRFVTINTFLTVFDEITWDIHGSKPFSSIDDMRDSVAPMYDQAYSTLLEELSQRGLLESTLVCSLAEFGRTPKINPNGGRDHWPQCWTVQFAGGGVQGGRVVGRSDATGAAPAERPVEPAEIVATIYRSLGLDLAATLPGPDGLATPLVDAGVREIHELF